MDLGSLLTASRAPERRLGPHEHDLDASALAGLRWVDPLSPFDRVSFPSDEQTGTVSPRQGAPPSLEATCDTTCSRIAVGYLAFNL